MRRKPSVEPFPAGASLVVHGIIASVRLSDGLGAQVLARLVGFGVKITQMPMDARRAGCICDPLAELHPARWRDAVHAHRGARGWPSKAATWSRHHLPQSSLRGG
jgi:hypothetical protein